MRTVEIKRKNWTIVVRGRSALELAIDPELHLPYTVREMSNIQEGLTEEYMSVSFDYELVTADNPEFAGNVGIDLLGLPGSREDISGVGLYHLDIANNHKRKGLGRFFFDVYRAIAIWVGMKAIGRVGGGDDTRAFYRSVGVPPEAIEYDDTSSAKFVTSAPKLIDDATRVYNA